MQDPSMYQQMNPQFPEHEQLKCPRCESTNTKFCYYNNYNTSQPRHFCRNCKRYWTKGGTLRNVPIGGGTRSKNTKRTSSNPKRSSSFSSSSSSSSTTARADATPEPSDLERGRPMIEANGQFGNLMEGMNPNHGSIAQLGEFGENLNSKSGLQSSSNNFDNLMGFQSGDGWPDPAIYTPGSTLQ
ncbi:dof zinc finger protein DOF3.1-like [Camellia sinensis]|uniref:Dof zinc finger protein n=1 Tax=Camellia sinensis var. sinensis TaxID=542762 RepID=A0A4S4F254_CAMSN|nr:dof zinc finger protein DOF3.1-like [Camellia sinensis]THG23538.1 hypothetical protein TEA_021312 [Camellia sinensis var. sinensis]